MKKYWGGYWISFYQYEVVRGFLFGAIVLPIVILNFVVAFVLPKFLNDLDLTRQFRFVGGRVGSTWCGRGVSLGG